MSGWIEVVLNVPVYQSFTYRKLDTCEKEILTGRRVEVRFGSRTMIGFVVADLEKLPSDFPLSAEAIKPILRVVDKEPLYGQNEIALARWIAAFYLCSEGEALGAMIPSGKRESSEAGLSFENDEFATKPVELSMEQKSAVEGIIDSSVQSPAYLFGLTGTGKTEVFLQAAEKILERGLGIIYLVPEIALTHQVIESVVSRFGSKAAVLHSGLTGSKKLAEWMRIKRGEATIVVGARSAVFAPLEHVGLIIIDEEHDSSYKSGTTPRYHARQVAMHRCAQAKCPLVMGSATPSLEAWYQMKSGSIRTFQLTQRLSGGDIPEIRIVNLGGTQGALSDTLIQEIRESKESGRQSILFLNRRGFTHFFRCNTCGFELKCKNCSVPMTWHKKQGVMKCHYCGSQLKPPRECPSCFSLDIGYAGFGTEFIEDEVKRTFPNFSVKRIDTDSLTKKGELQEALNDFRHGNTDILLGTQMIAKGLNFPGVRLVGIVLADTGLHMPDFRASERTFSLIVQVAGRAGRFFPDGRVLIQTWSPRNPAIVYASTADVEGFYTWELKNRSSLGFPPFTRLIRLVFRSKTAAIAEKGAEGAAKILTELIATDADLMGPAECPLAMVSGNYRYHIIVRGTNLMKMIQAVRTFQTSYKPLSGIYIEIDVDPASLL
ncbi:MAG TPA: primosomal protein N' [Treponemataceae bacterium]|nr:primosomal protein N' [Treponemataceae bacterium]